MGVHPGKKEKSRPSEGSVYDVAHVATQLLGMCNGGEGGGQKIFVPFPHVGIFGDGEDCGGRQGGRGTAAWEPNWDQILGLGGYNPHTANKGAYRGKGTQMTLRRMGGVKESSAGPRARRMAGVDRATLAAEILRQHDETRRGMGEPQEELRTAVGLWS